MRGGCDEGFCFIYWKLSYRRKFYRTLWTLIPVAVVLGTLWAANPESRNMRVGVFFLGILGLGLVQALYNYWLWQSEAAAERPVAPGR